MMEVRAIWPPLCESAVAGEGRDIACLPSGEDNDVSGDGKMATNKGHTTKEGEGKNGQPGGQGGNAQHGTDQGKTDSSKGEKNGYGSSGSKSSGGTGASGGSGGGTGGNHT